MADVELTGLDEVIAKMTEKLGEARVNRVVNKAMREVAEEAEDDLKSAVSAFADTGQTVAQTTHSNVSRADYGIPTVKIGWGQGSRWRLEHLQEFGYTRYGKSYSPRGRGVLRNYVNMYESKYKKQMQDKLKELAK
ncbi:HK97 gp10 family phage protein [Streptococcus hyointestinalis]|nr:HK97 gp10 family phage protein [Streptococcus hyointestinalis]